MKRTSLQLFLKPGESQKYYRKPVLCITNACVFFVLLISLALAGTTVVLAAEEDYLEQLAAEAENTAKQAKPAMKRDAKTQKQFNKMEAKLASERPTTYKFYEKLSNKKKEKVFKVHMSKNKLSLTSKTVMDLYFSN